MTTRSARDSFCEFGYRNPKEHSSHMIYPRADLQAKNLCQRCYSLFRNNIDKDWTTEILYFWAIECGAAPQLPKSIMTPMKRVELVAYLTDQIGIIRNSMNNQFLVFLNESMDSFYKAWYLIGFLG
jgi:hypothetical protein